MTQTEERPGRGTGAGSSPNAIQGVATAEPTAVLPEFVRQLDAAGVPLFVAPARGRGEFDRPKGWQDLTAEGNTERLAAWQPGWAVCAVCGPALTVLDVDPRNGGNPEQVMRFLDERGIRRFANVITPGGGVHYYVAGHPDLRKFIIPELPGVDLQARYANVFVPGTERPKYDGRGYVPTGDLDPALIDGDPAVDQLYELYLEHEAQRVAKDDKRPAAPVWSGGEVSPRAAAYAASALAGEADEVAKTSVGGRQARLYVAAVKLGSLMAGSGVPAETEIRSALLDAAARNGLLAEDGETSVLRQIERGIDYGTRTPRAAREPEPILDIEPEVEPVAPVALDEAHQVFRGWLGEDYDLDALDVVLAAAAVERLDGDPLWLLLISGSGNAKTETVQALSHEAIITSTVSSVGALLSATPKKEHTSGATGGLLRKIGNRGVLVIKDVTSILSMGREQRAEVLAALREVYDGSWHRNVGTDGGRTLSWSGRIVCIGAVTTAWDKAHSVIAAMGDRFVLLRMDSTKGRRAAGRQAIGNTGAEEAMRAELADVAAGVLAGMATEVEPVTEAESERLLDAADLVTLARTAVEYDYRGDVIDAHAPEMPTRFAKQLAQVVRGAVALGVSRERALHLAIRCARDSMPPLRLQILDDLAEHPNSTTNDVRKRLQLPRNTVDRQLQALHLLGVLVCDEDETYGRDGKRVRTRWLYSIAEGIDPDAIRVENPELVPDLLVHAPSPLEESDENEGSTRRATYKSGTNPAMDRHHGRERVLATRADWQAFLDEAEQ